MKSFFFRLQLVALRRRCRELYIYKIYTSYYISYILQGARHNVEINLADITVFSSITNRHCWLSWPPWSPIAQMSKSTSLPNIFLSGRKIQKRDGRSSQGRGSIGSWDEGEDPEPPGDQVLLRGHCLDNLGNTQIHKINNEQWTRRKSPQKSRSGQRAREKWLCVRVRCAPGNVLCGVSLICTMFEIELFGPEQVYFKQIAMLKDNWQPYSSVRSPMPSISWRSFLNKENLNWPSPIIARFLSSPGHMIDTQLTLGRKLLKKQIFRSLGLGLVTKSVSRSYFQFLKV